MVLLVRMMRDKQFFSIDGRQGIRCPRPIHCAHVATFPGDKPLGGSMSGTFTTSTARNIFYGGTVFFFLLFLALTYQTEQALPARDNRQNLTEQVIAGKKVWENNQCIGCHTLLGEGAYFAPELGNVYVRRGGANGGKEFIKAWIKSQPTGTPGRRQMPNFHLTDKQLDDVAEFLKYTSEINTAKWPPNKEG
jgi:nitric oxide reductase subunit C